MQDAISIYEDGGGALAEALIGLSPAHLDAPPPPGVAGAWTIRQIVIHLMDSDLIGSFRMKRVIAMDEPRLLAYDQDRFAQHLAYDRLDAHLAARIFHDNRIMTATILRTLPAEAFQRIGVHEERGRMTLAQLVQVYIDHLEHHLRFLRAKREAILRFGREALGPVRRA